MTAVPAHDAPPGLDGTSLAMLWLSNAVAIQVELAQPYDVGDNWLGQTKKGAGLSSGKHGETGNLRCLKTQ